MKSKKLLKLFFKKGYKTKFQDFLSYAVNLLVLLNQQIPQWAEKNRKMTVVPKM